MKAHDHCPALPAPPGLDSLGTRTTFEQFLYPLPATWYRGGGPSRSRRGWMNEGVSPVGFREVGVRYTESDSRTRGGGGVALVWSSEIWGIKGY